jgi:hypothetical protein
MLQMRDFHTEGLVIRAYRSNDGSLEGNGGPSRVASPIILEGQRRLCLAP